MRKSIKNSVFFFLKSIYNFNDELFVSLINGEIIKLNWNSLNEYSFVSIKQVPLKLELTDNAKCIDWSYSIIYHKINVFLFFKR